MAYQVAPCCCCCCCATLIVQELEVFAVSVYDIAPLSCLTNLQELDLHQVRH
jgi:hypothetical protein